MSRREGEPLDIQTLREIEQRVLWLATRMIDNANQGDDSEIKVGGHQASSASITTIMTALWFAHLSADDLVAVKPHASPVFHAITYLIGDLDQSYLKTLRQFGGLQAYPSRTKDPDTVDFSTGSVGLGAVAPLFSAHVRRYVDDHFQPRPSSRFIALVGDAELDEGNVWEAAAEPALQGLGNYTMIVDLNRQSLDRVVPEIAATRLMGFFADAGWHVSEAKYGRRLTAAFADTPNGELRDHIDAMANEAYQELFGLSGDDFRRAFLAHADPIVERWAEQRSDDDLKAVVTDLGGHDLEVVLDALRECDAATDRPSVLFAYTIKGHGLPMAGDALNHSALLGENDIDQLRERVGLTPEDEWSRFPDDSRAGRLCNEVGRSLSRRASAATTAPPVPQMARNTVTAGRASTQETFGRVVSSLADVPGVGELLVTAAPDVSISTGLGGFINKRGVYSHTEEPDHGGSRRLLRWSPKPSGQHIELGISEMNMFMLLGQLGLSDAHHQQQLLPIGTVYDPFVLRGLDAFIYGLYNDSRFVVVGTPAGVTLSPEGGAHQSTITPSVGAELPNLTYCEPAYATEVDWLLCEALDRIGRPNGTSTYLRLSTRPIDQQPFGAALAAHGEDRLRSQVIAGGYRLIDAPPDGRPGVTIVTTGPLAPEAIGAAGLLDAEGVAATVIHLTSPDRLYRSWRDGFVRSHRAARIVRRPSHLHLIVPPGERNRPVVSVHDAASHSLAWLGSALGTRQFTLGVDRFGESGSITDLHRAVGIDTESIVNASLIAISE